jgi:hypothetical protein
MMGGEQILVGREALGKNAVACLPRRRLQTQPGRWLHANIANDQINTQMLTQFRAAALPATRIAMQVMIDMQRAQPGVLTLWVQVTECMQQHG